MRRAAAATATVLACLAGCAELGVVGDGTSVSIGRPSGGYIVDGVRMPNSGEGFFTRQVWATRGQRYGTDELVDLLVAVSRRMAQGGGTRLVIADLSGKGGGPAYAWHRSHQSGRDVDLLYYVRDAKGQAVEADSMRVLNGLGVARDGSGISLDVPRTWQLVRELLTAPEAVVQWVFMYEPIAVQLLAHAESIGEPEAILVRARRAMKQPGDSARHDDHIHVRIYCAPADRAYGCVDAGPWELLAEREAERAAAGGELAAVLVPAPGAGASALGAPQAAGAAAEPVAVPAGASAAVSTETSTSAPVPRLELRQAVEALSRALRVGVYK